MVCEFTLVHPESININGVPNLCSDYSATNSTKFSQFGLKVHPVLTVLSSLWT